MNTFVLKLVLAPVIIGGASLAGRRWGPAVSGWLVGLPLTSGPVIFFLALSHGPAFAAAAISGTLSGGFSLVAFCLVYAWLARRSDWRISLTGSMLAYFGIVLLMQNSLIPFAPLIIAVTLTIVLGLFLMPRNGIMQPIGVQPGRWDIPSRILIGTVFIILLTELAPWLGARLTGLLATIPLYTTILAVFAHRLQGGAGAAHVLRGLLFGLFGFAGFFLALALLIERAGITIGFLSAIVAALVIQGLSLLILRMEQRGKDALA
ncbi:MAG TPA: hypothetical protein VLZ89_14345 [Anaerolineales bacterium]|nr:hypothetical protein [Anaerolineales bacterium]